LRLRGKYMLAMFECKEEGGKYVPDLKKIPETVSIINVGLRIRVPVLQD